jgi:hypothetical protein
MKPIAASLLTLATLTSCYVWTPPQQGGPGPGGVVQGPSPEPTRYIEAPPQGPVGLQQGPLTNDPAAPQAPNYTPPAPPQNGNGNAQSDPSTKPPVQQKPVEPTKPETKPTQPAPANNLPYGIKVPSKPGFVLSPHDKSARIVDVQGIASGTKVKCPYTQKTFLVP